MFLLKLPNKLKMIASGLTYALGAAGVFVLAYASVIQTNHSINAATRTGVLSIPLYPFFMIQVVCVSVLGITMVWEMVKSFYAIGNEELLKDLTADWV